MPRPDNDRRGEEARREQMRKVRKENALRQEAYETEIRNLEGDGNDTQEKLIQNFPQFSRRI